MATQPAPAVLRKRLTITPTVEGQLWASLFLYGPPGAGKTVFAGTAEDDARSAPVLFCDVEGGTMSIDHRMREGRKVERFVISNYKRDINELYAFFQDYDGHWDELPYKTLVIDSLSKLAERGLASIVAENRRPGGKPEYGDWHTITLQMRALTAFLRDLPIHRIITGLEEVEEGRAFPFFPGKKIAPNLPADFDMVGRLVVEKEMGKDNVWTYTRRLCLQNETRYVAKDRSDPTGQLPREIDSPTVTKLLDRIEEGKRLAIRAEEQKAKAS